MPTPNEKRALIFLAALGALGVGMRAFRGAPPASPAGHAAEESRAALGRQIGAVDSATLAKRATVGRDRSRRTPAGADTMPAAKPDVLGRRPGRRPSRRLERDGRTGAEEAAAPDPLALYEERRLEVARRNRDAQARIERDFGGARPASAAPPARVQVGSRAGGTPSREPVDLDTADADAIASLPWVGPALAARIVADRDARGPFGSLAGLGRVRGIGPGLTAKIGQFVSFSRLGSGSESVVKFRAVRVRPKRP